MADFADWVSLLSAAGLGSVVGTLVAQGSDRRQSRAAVLRAIELTETARRRTGSQTRDAAHELLSAALIAGLPRKMVLEYAAIAQAAAWATEQARDETNGADDEPHPAFHGLVLAASAAVVALVWHPLLGRPGSALRARRLRQRMAEAPGWVRDFVDGAREHL